MSRQQLQATLPRLWQPTQPVFWLWVGLCLVMGTLGIVEIVMEISSVGAVIAATLMMFVQAVLFWLILRVLPRFRRQPRSLQWAAFIWGFTATCGLAIFANSPYDEPLRNIGLGSFTASLTAPINEDAFRLLGVLIVLVLAYGKRLTVMDGVVYGFIVGSGFELIENMLFAVRGDGFTGAIGSGVTRVLMGFGLHSLWTVIGGAALAYCLSRRQRGLGGRWWVLVLLVPIPMLLHAAWDAPSVSVLAALDLALAIPLYLLTVGIFLFMVKWGRKSEFQWFAERSGSPLGYREFTRLARAERKRIAAEAVAEESRAMAAAAALAGVPAAALLAEETLEDPLPVANWEPGGSDNA